MPFPKMSAPDWDALANEAADLLQRYIRIDTSNPPGNEALACDFIEAVLSAEGIPSRRLTSAPGRDTLIADLPAPDSDAKPLVLLNHTDVVPVEKQYWSVDPFAGVIKDGYLWGRGTLDMKGMGILELVTLLNLKRRDVRLRRPVRFFAVADEEAGSNYGIEWLDKHHPETLDAAFVLNEGGYGSTSYLGVERPLFGISVAEKSPLWLTLKATGLPGHGATPHDDNVLDRIVRAMQRVQSWQRPLVLTQPVVEALRAARAEGYVEVDPDRASAEEIASRHRQLKVLLQNTISATGLHSGMKHNVIPATASATIDCRLVPGYSSDRFINELRGVIGDPRIEIETVFSSESKASPLDTELMTAIRDATAAVMPGAPLLPRVMVGFTDSRTFRRRGVPSYGFVPMLLAPNEQSGMHGHNERISLTNIRLGVEVMAGVVERLCAE